MIATGDSTKPVTTFSAKNCGRTPSQIISYSFDITYLTSVDDMRVPPEYIDGKVIHPDWLAVSDSFPIPKKAGFDRARELNDAKSSDLTKEGKRMIFWGRVVYRDSIKTDAIRETRFCYFTDPVVDGFFTIGGPAEYNKHT